MFLADFKSVARWIRASIFGDAYGYRNKKTGFYSQIGQDVFVSRVLKRKFNGFYIEVGGYHPYQYSNSYYLESKFGFRGVSIEKDPDRAKSFEAVRRNECVCTDVFGLSVDYFLTQRGAPLQIDYLSIDIEPNSNNLACLKAFISSGFRFSVVTFEHNKERPLHRDQQVWQEAQKFMADRDYKIAVSDVRLNGFATEDWFIDNRLLGSGELSEDYLDRLMRRSSREYLFVI